MIQSFKDRATEDIFNGVDSKAARRACPSEILKVARRKLDQINRVTSLGELAIPPRNELEPLKGSRKGQHSIRINKQYRICFRWTSSGPEHVEVTDYHG